MTHRWTWQKLAQNSERLNPKSRGRNYPSVPKFENLLFTSGPNSGQKVIVPFMGTKSVLISMRAWGVTQSSLHKVVMLYSDVDIQTQDPHSLNYFQIYYDGKMYWIHKLDRLKNPLTVRCSCADFYHTWSYYNYNNGCLYGPKPKMYVRKTDWMPPRNPQHIPGLCKHVFHAWTILRNSGFTVN